MVTKIYVRVFLFILKRGFIDTVGVGELLDFRLDEGNTNTHTYTRCLYVLIFAFLLNLKPFNAKLIKSLQRRKP